MFVTIDTKHKNSKGKTDERTVTLDYNSQTKKTILLGGLLHGCEIAVTQDLINNLQEIFNNQQKES